MGNRIIISETEKKSILSLYETTQHTPFDSVLVANKNPFNGSEYVDYRKQYSKDLKEGDGFFILNDTKFNKWVYGINNQFLFGKTIRLKSDSGNEVTMSIPSFNIITPNLKSNVCIKELFFDNNKMRFSIYVISDGSGLGQVTYYDKRENEYYYLPEESKEKLFKIINENYTWNKVPDECFELRKIETQKTDF